jgi:uncharacterized membrane protein YeaQ/YmgE (transglycosylase-associated protein family)
MVTDSIGALCFGLVVGWVTYRTIRRKTQDVTLSDIAGVIGAVGGAAVTSLFGNGHLFAWYAIGLAAGFFLYLIIGSTVAKRVTWLGD